VKLMYVERPSALLAACAQVGVRVRSAAADAHVALVGRTAVWAAPLVYGAKGITGFTVSNIISKQQRINGLSGVPPRGSPV
jgi:hypothetical protein